MTHAATHPMHASHLAEARAGVGRDALLSSWRRRALRSWSGGYGTAS